MFKLKKQNHPRNTTSQCRLPPPQSCKLRTKRGLTLVLWSLISLDNSSSPAITLNLCISSSLVIFFLWNKHIPEIRTKQRKTKKNERKRISALKGKAVYSLGNQCDVSKSGPSCQQVKPLKEGLTTGETSSMGMWASPNSPESFLDLSNWR